ncbi:MAG: 5-(carboxyamino)imidazole ribonucleotide synthase [Acidimicrobiia bacterium]
MTRLTVLGGGQLGRMLALAAAPLGVEVATLDPSPDATARAVSDLTVGALDDVAAARAAARGSEIVTFEWEGVPASTTRALAADGWVVRPGTDALEVSQDRIREKATFAALGIPVAPHAPVSSRTELVEAVATFGVPTILKTCRGGYDGKGQAVIESADDVGTAWDALGPAGTLVLESRIAFDREMSIVAVRAADGEVRTWPLVENHHRGGILRTSIAPAPAITPTLQAQADEYARVLLDHFDYVGVLTVELFQVGDTLIANEMAPRVHNSGHWTIEGAATSQFENHVRAVLGWPLGSTEVTAPSVMINCIGALPAPEVLLGLPGVHLHNYAKALRPGRKVGHITVTGPDPATLAERTASVRAVLPPAIG